MSKETYKEDKKKEMEALQGEYTKLCAMAGDKQFQRDVLSAEIRQINVKLSELNMAFRDAKSKADGAQAVALVKEEAVPTTPTEAA